MNTTRLKVNQDITILKSDVRRLRDDVVDMIYSARSRSKDTVMETGSRIREMMTGLGGRAKEQVRGKSQTLKNRGYEAMESWRGGVEHRPMTSLIIAFAAGLVFAFLMGRKRY